MPTASRPTQKPQVRELLERLETQYGQPTLTPRADPVDELVACILSQHTSDLNSYAAFDRLKGTYPSWDVAADTPPEEIAKVIWQGGLANSKAKKIVDCLRAVRDRVGKIDLELLREMPVAEARAWLEDLPGVGPKTASLVLCFCFGKDLVPVDTHVFRVGWRLGWYEQKVGADKAHDLYAELVPEGLAFRFHMALIVHGRMLCKAQNPKCEACPVRPMCQWGKA